MWADGRPIDLDLDPLEVLRRWPAGRRVVMLHSGRLHPRWSRYCLIAEPEAALQFSAGRTRWLGPARPGMPAWNHDPLRDLEAALDHDRCLYVGYLGYDLARQIEKIPNLALDDHGFPDLQFCRCPSGLIYDRQHRRWSAFGRDLAADLRPLDNGRGQTSSAATFSADIKADRPPADHLAAVEAGLNYIAAGDVFQVNLAHRFTGSITTGSGRDIFRSLTDQSPAWYAAYLELLTEDAEAAAAKALASTSPELFLEVDPAGLILTRPIKGTLPADRDPDDLRRSAKDAAELHMIVDLLRNDLGRVCDYGSIHVEQPRSIETHPTIHHGVATVTGRLHPQRSLRHLLRATFPGGSITGAPKIRAMQIIEELEPVRRGPYCGAIGWIQRQDTGWALQPNIAIRTLLLDLQRKQVRFSVGGGIVADSVPEAEYAETLTKAQAMMRALRGEPRAQ